MALSNGTMPVINQMTTQDCTDVSDLCPVDQTIYGYYPNLGGNAFFLALFAVTGIVNVIQGIKYKTWTYMIALSVGSLAEVIGSSSLPPRFTKPPANILPTGYAGRVIMHDNPWSGVGFNMQICCLIIAPAFIAAGLYLTLKHAVIELSPDFSRIQPRLYTWIFIFCDILSLVLQGAGGGTAASAAPGDSAQDIGTDLMIAGIVWQVITLLVFGALVADYAWRCSKRTLQSSAYQLLGTLRFKLFLGSLVFAYLTIFTRCVYRIAELGPGWRNEIMQSEVEFMVLDGAMIAIATVCLTVFHPGYTFPEMQMHKNLPAGAEKAADLEAPSPDMAGQGPRQGGMMSKLRMGRR